jgi:hypothetical protein
VEEEVEEGELLEEGEEESEINDGDLDPHAISLLESLHLSHAGEHAAAAPAQGAPSAHAAAAAASHYPGKGTASRPSQGWVDGNSANGHEQDYGAGDWSSSYPYHQPAYPAYAGEGYGAPSQHQQACYSSYPWYDWQYSHMPQYRSTYPYSYYSGHIVSRDTAASSSCPACALREWEQQYQAWSHEYAEWRQRFLASSPA